MNMTQVIEAFEQERAKHAERVAAIDAVIAGIRKIYAVPEDPVQAVTRPRATPAPATKGNGAARKPGSKPTSAITLDRVQAALRGGPLFPQRLAVALGIRRSTVRKHMTPFEAQGVIVSTGNGRGRRYALPGKLPAKEAP